jgi:hypothetical protein
MDQLAKNWPACRRGSKITLAEFWGIHAVRFNAMESRDKRGYVPIWSDDCVLARLTAVGIADNLSTQLSR